MSYSNSHNTEAVLGMREWGHAGGEEENVQHSCYELKLTYVTITSGVVPRDKAAHQVRRESGVPEVGDAVGTPENSSHTVLEGLTGALPQ